ncbi:LADA_0C11166g1_1 [Lachancea dasiensis]|uniref:LADA_0C11166g1_1 n=1 Tax=Lachancea dasiensis TaxID=1072105 RepID=A0A1G4J214_9SACH|nr:LADA_0C11166g1_1 [Lachancea dasiensis]
MADGSTFKRSPTTPSTPGIRDGIKSKKVKREEEQSPTRLKKSAEVSVEEMTRRHIINNHELQRVRELVKFLELERKFKA